jgi:16S rRNA (guanine527-N7)-methyltransferase
MPARPATQKIEAFLVRDRARAVALIGDLVSRETWARLDGLVALLLKWQDTTNLVAPSTLAEIWTRHIADSLQLLTIAPKARAWIDLGSGGGFPGLVVACAMAEHSAGKIDLVESNQKKSAFLREAIRILGVPAIVHARRIEDFVDTTVQSFDVVSARALAPLEKLIGYASPLLKTGAIGLFPKGQGVEDELTAASKSWTIEADLVPSVTDPQARIVIVRRATKLTHCNF